MAKVTGVRIGCMAVMVCFSASTGARGQDGSVRSAAKESERTGSKSRNADTTIRPPGVIIAVDPTGQDREPARETLGTDSILVYIEAVDVTAGTR